jgi:hypothetical protein
MSSEEFMEEIRAAADQIDEQAIQQVADEIRRKHEGNTWDMNRLNMIAYEDQE